MLDRTRRWAIPVILTTFIACTAFLVYATLNRSFSMDNLLHFTEIEQYVSKGIIPVAGASMSGLPARVPGAMNYYPLMAVYAMTHSFVSLRFLGMSLGLLFAVLFIAWLYRSMDKTMAAAASGMLLFNPYFLNGASDFWAAYFIFPAMALLIMALIRVGTTGAHSWHTACIIPLAAVMAQIHVATLFIVPPLVIIYLLRHYRAWQGAGRWRYMLIGVAGGFLLYLPYLIAEIGNGFANTRLMFAGNASHRSGMLLPQIYAFFIFPTNEITYFLGKGTKPLMDFYFRNNPLGMVQLAANIITLAISFAGNILAVFCLVPALKKHLRGYEAPVFLKEGLFLGYTGVAVVLVVFTALNLPKGVWHYFYALYPLAFFPVLLIFDFIRAKLPRIAVGFCIFIAVNAAIALSVYWRYVDIYQKPSNISNSMALAKAVLDDSNGKKFFILNSELEKYGSDSYISVFGIDPQYKAVARLFLRTNWNEVYDRSEDITYVVDNILYPFQPSFWKRIDGLVTVWSNSGVALYRSRGRIPYPIPK
ncbi:MAG: hypothetical protein AABZ39_12770 [Spirochaetota bacterium]